MLKMSSSGNDLMPLQPKLTNKQFLEMYLSVYFPLTTYSGVQKPETFIEKAFILHNFSMQYKLSAVPREKLESRNLKIFT